MKLITLCSIALTAIDTSVSKPRKIHLFAQYTNINELQGSEWEQWIEYAK